ncbi:MAG: RluA family pseudouridine synthase [Planctomycetota bacterium]
MTARRGDDFDVRVLDGRRESLSYRVADGEQGMRLDQFLAKRLHWRSRSSVCRLLDEGRVELLGRPTRANRRVGVGDRVVVQLPRPLRDDALAPRGGDVSLPRLHEDEALIAIDKPPHIPVHPSGRLLHHTVITALHREYRDFDDPTRDVRPKLCHRLDIETSGVLLVAKTDAALTHVQAQFEKRTVGKEYLVLVHGVVEDDERTIDLPLGPAFDARMRTQRVVRHDVGQPAQTRFRVRRRWRDHTLCHVQLLTGRHHQIRAHMAAIGHPVVGDKLYGRDSTIFLRYGDKLMTDADRALLELPRQALHSHALEFRHPTRGPMRIESPWPADLVAFCDGLPAN